MLEFVFKTLPAPAVQQKHHISGIKPLLAAQLAMEADTVCYLTSRHQTCDPLAVVKHINMATNNLAGFSIVFAVARATKSATLSGLAVT